MGLEAMISFRCLFILLITTIATNFYPNVKASKKFQIHSSLENNTSFNQIKNNVKWSILIPTIKDRGKVFKQLYYELTKQIRALNLTDKVEIIYFRDKRNENPVGFKRNLLLDKSLGEYVCFIDDDDLVHENYIQMIYEKLLQNPDCVSLTGIITINNKTSRKFIHSVEYTSLFDQDSIACRPPNHLNPIKRSIAIQFKFPLENVGEDTAWAMQICQYCLYRSVSRNRNPTRCWKLSTYC